MVAKQAVDNNYTLCRKNSTLDI